MNLGENLFEGKRMDSPEPGEEGDHFRRTAAKRGWGV